MLLMGIAHEGPNIRHKVLTIFRDGTERLSQLRYVIGGETDVKIADMPGTAVANWAGEELRIISRLGTDRDYIRLIDCWLLSADGATLTMAHRDDALAGQVCILERTPPDQDE